MDEAEKIKKETLEKGGVLAKFYFDVHSNQKEILKNLMLDLISNNILKEEGVVYAYGTIEEPIENNGLFSTSAEVTILAKGFLPLLNLAIKYSPFAVEVLEPYQKNFGAQELQEILLRVSEISSQFAEFVLQKVLSQEEKNELNKKILNRAELIKKFFQEKKR
ncbi:MAG: hypothetical protein ACP5HJ_00245 [Candidatus Micrarchaeia archaeon]